MFSSTHIPCYTELLHSTASTRHLRLAHCPIRMIFWAFVLVRGERADSFKKLRWEVGSSTAKVQHLSFLIKHASSWYESTEQWRCWGRGCSKGVILWGEGTGRGEETVNWMIRCFIKKCHSSTEERYAVFVEIEHQISYNWHTYIHLYYWKYFLVGSFVVFVWCSETWVWDLSFECTSYWIQKTWVWQ